jgi:hypothetical protein
MLAATRHTLIRPALPGTFSRRREKGAPINFTIRYSLFTPNRPEF